MASLSVDTAARARPRRFSRIARREAIAGYVFIGPWLLGLLVFVAGPMLAGLYFSLTDYPILSMPTWVGLANYQAAFGDSLFWQSLGNTAFYTLLFVPTGVALALILALLVNRAAAVARIFRTIFFMPTVVPAVALTALWIWLLQPQYGLVNFALGLVGITGPDWLLDPNWTKPALVLLSLWGVGNGMVIFLAGLQSIPEHLHEAAAVDGAGAWTIFWRITLPQLSPTTFFVTVLTCIGAFQIFTQAYVLGSLNQQWALPGGPLGSLMMLVVYIFANGFFYFKMGYASALAWILFVIIAAITLLQFWLARRWVYYEWEETR
jgi:multiple sugar transport system permease protein